MAANSNFAIKRKAVPTLLPQDFTPTPLPATKTSQQTVIHHTISLPNFNKNGTSPKKRSVISSKLKKMLSLTRLNTNICPKASSSTHVPSSQTNSTDTGAHWAPLSPLSPQSTDQSAFSRPPSVLSSSNPGSSSTSPTSATFSASASSIRSFDSKLREGLNAYMCPFEQNTVEDDEELEDVDVAYKFRDQYAPTLTTTAAGTSPSFRTDAEFDLATPVSSKSLLTSWYDDWFETTQTTSTHHSQSQSTSPQSDSTRRQVFFLEETEPRSFFEDDSDDDYPISDSASEYSYMSILPECTDSDSDEEDQEDDEEDGDVTLTVGRRVTIHRASASCRVLSASSDDSHSSSSSTPRNRDSLQLERGLAF